MEEKIASAEAILNDVRFDVRVDIHVKYLLERIWFLLKFFDFMKRLISYIIDDEKHFSNFFLSMLVFMFFTNGPSGKTRFVI